jgi:tetratricopeptide (TPR) repeat protein
MRIRKSTLYLIGMLVVLSLLGGCAGVGPYATVVQPQLTPAEEDRVGTAVEGKLIQMLGGPYHDKLLVNDLNRHIQNNLPFKVSVADRSTPALYPLPGDRFIVTRGLLARVSNLTTLKSLLTHAVRLSTNLYKDRATRSMVRTTEEVLLVSNSIYDPDSAVIRLARLFEHEACVQECEAIAQASGAVVDATTSADLPESIKRLSEMRPWYELGEDAQKAEKADDQAKAIALYLQAATTTPDEPRILGSLGLAYLRAGQLQSARLHLQKAVKLQPDYYRTQMGLGYLYLQQGKLPQANQALTRSVRMLPVAENLFLLAEVQEKSGDVKGATTLYKLVVEFDRYSKLGRASAARLAESAGGQ